MNYELETVLALKEIAAALSFFKGFLMFYVCMYVFGVIIGAK